MELLKKYGSFDSLFGELGLCFDFQGKLPKMNYFTCTTTSSLDPSCWEAQEASREEYDFAVANEAFANRIGLQDVYKRQAPVPFIWWGSCARTGKPGTCFKPEPHRLEYRK